MIDIMLCRLTRFCEWLVISELLYSIVFVAKKQVEISLFFINGKISNKMAKNRDTHVSYAQEKGTKMEKQNEKREIGKRRGSFIPLFDFHFCLNVIVWLQFLDDEPRIIVATAMKDGYMFYLCMLIDARVIGAHDFRYNR